MAIVHIRVGGREYDLACDDGQEEQLRYLADELDERVSSITHAMGHHPGESLGLLMAALTMADELIESKQEVEQVKAEINRLAAHLEDDRGRVGQDRMQEIEHAMAVTLEEIAQRIETIADQVEMG